MTDTICLDENYSTTKLLTKEKPVVENKPEDKLETVLFLPEGKNRKGEGGLRTEGYFKKSYKNKPLITIVTVVYNGEEHLEQTIKSVIEQSYDNVEYIIVDGGSTDGTLDIIKKYEEQIDYWVSEKDEGIYDAMNKGISLIIGEYIAFLNADDFYFQKNIVEKIAILCKERYIEVIYGDMIIKDDYVERVEKAHHIGVKYGVFSYSMSWIWVRMVFGHPSSFVAKQSFEKLGGFRQSFKIAADYDFFLRLHCNKSIFHYLPEVVAVFREGGISTTDDLLLEQENALVLQKNNRLIAFVVLWIRKVFGMIKK